MISVLSRNGQIGKYRLPNKQERDFVMDKEKDLIVLEKSYLPDSEGNVVETYDIPVRGEDEALGVYASLLSCLISDQLINLMRVLSEDSNTHEKGTVIEVLDNKE